jgi:uncharacterized protein YjiS (DUF1127 family)
MDTFWSAYLPGWGWRFVSVSAQLLRLSDGLETWRERARQRAALSRLDERLLADIGLSRTDAVFEYDKPFWRE